MWFINTRPTSRAATLTSFLQSKGITVVDLPLLTLTERALQFDDISALQGLLGGEYRVVIIVSETAATYGLQQLRALTDSPNLKLSFIAVGEATARLFFAQWQASFTSPCPPLITPTSEQLPENNEGMLGLKVIQQLSANDKVLIWRGVGGRELLADTLAQRGIIVDHIVLYERRFPDHSTPVFHQLYHQILLQDASISQVSNTEPSVPIWVLISSLTAWQHWCQLLGEVSTTVALPTALARFNYLILQARIANHVAAQTPATYKVVDSLNPELLWQALTAPPT